MVPIKFNGRKYTVWKDFDYETFLDWIKRINPKEIIFLGVYKNKEVMYKVKGFEWLIGITYTNGLQDGSTPFWTYIYEEV